MSVVMDVFRAFFTPAPKPKPADMLAFEEAQKNLKVARAKLLRCSDDAFGDMVSSMRREPKRRSSKRSRTGK